MKRYAWLMVACLVWAFVLAAESGAATEAGEVLAIRKSVFLERDGQRNTASPQMPLFMKDAVITDVKSRAKLYFRDDSILNLGELSRVEVEQYIERPDQERSKSIYRLIDGTLRVVVGDSDLEIHTPTAVAAARGTRFIMSVEEISKVRGPLPGGEVEQQVRSCILVFEGEVELRNSDETLAGSVVVREGEVSCVPELGEPEKPVRADSQSAEEAISRITVLGQFPDDREPLRLPESVFATLLQDRRRGAVPPIEQEPIDPLGVTPVRFQLIFQ